MATLSFYPQILKYFLNRPDTRSILHPWVGDTVAAFIVTFKIIEQRISALSGKNGKQPRAAAYLWAEPTVTRFSASINPQGSKPLPGMHGGHTFLHLLGEFPPVVNYQGIRATPMLAPASRT